MKRTKLLERLKLLSKQNKNNKNRDSRRFKPEADKTYKVRVLPWNPDESPEDWDPIKDMQYFYNVATFGVLVPSHYGKPDPISDYLKKLKDNWDDNLHLIKKLRPNERFAYAVLVRGEEGKGIQWMEVSKEVSSDILSHLLDQEYGDLLDLDTGRDFKLETVKKKMGNDGSTYNSIKATVAANPSPAYTDNKQLQTWFQDMPDPIEDMGGIKDPEWLEDLLKRWIEGGFEKVSYKKDKEENKNFTKKESNSEVELEDADDEEEEEKQSSKVKLPPKKNVGKKTSKKEEPEEEFDDIDSKFNELDDDLEDLINTD